MYRSPKYLTSPDQVEEFVASMRQGTIISVAPSGFPQVSILPFVKSGDEIELHFVQLDPTFQALQENPRCSFLVSDFLAFTPHHFVDPVDGGRATLHFRAVAYECEAHSVSTAPEDVAGALRRLLAHHEPGASYEPMGVNDFYGPRLQMLGTARLKIMATHAKFKVGPAAEPAVKQAVADRLRERAEPGDERAAEVIETYLRRDAIAE
jgi:predicted FMN-binding regulatory protein PaiB